MRRPVALLVTVAALTTGCTVDSTEATGRATVVGVVDGDTIDVRVAGREERVRLIGLDTPETKRPDTPVECHGPEASAFTAALLPPGTVIRIERDVVGRDHFGRILGYVHLPENGQRPAVFVNREIVEQGYAVPLTIEPNDRHATELAAAATRAEAADLGLWGACRG